MGCAYARTSDGLPYIGPHRNFPHHLFAFGDSSRSVTGAYLASRDAAAPSSRRDSKPADTAFCVSRAMDALTSCSSSGPTPTTSKSALGGIVARHAALGLRVGLCDLTAGEMGSNGTVEERLKEAEAARQVLGAAWRENLAGRIAGSERIPRIDDAVTVHPAAPAASRGRRRTGSTGIPITQPRARWSTEAVFNSGLRRYPAVGEPWKVGWMCYYFINDGAAPVVSSST